MTRALKARLLFTLAAVAIYEAGAHIPLPRAVSPVSIFRLGIVPYFTASYVVLLLSGIIPYLRRLRDGPAAANATLDRIIYGATAVIAFFQGWGLSLLVSDMGAGSRAVTATLLAAGAILLAWLADQVSRRGLVNGVALIMSITLLTVMARMAEAGGVSFGFLIVVGGLLALCIVMVRSERRIPLEYAGEGEQSGDIWTPSVVLRPNMVGVLPVSLAVLAMSPLHAVGVTRGSATAWMLYCGMIVLFTYVWTAITFNEADVRARLQRYGFRLAGADSATLSDDHLERIVVRLVAKHAAFLVSLVVIPSLAVAQFDISDLITAIAGPSLLILVATTIAFTDNLRVLLRRAARIGPSAGDWVPVFEADTDLEVDLARGILERAGIPTVRSSNRVIPVTGTLAFWESSRPSYPSLTINRRLGDGHVYAAVPADLALRAQSLLAPYREPPVVT